MADLTLDIAELEAELSNPIPEKVYAELRERYIYCVCCGSAESLQSHHIVYRSQGGPTTLENLILLCGNSCHPRSHGRVVNGKESFKIMYLDGGLCVMERTGEVRVLDMRPHVPTAAAGEGAFALHEVILDFKRHIERNFWSIGSALKLMQESEAYRVLGHDTFNGYIASPELSFSRSWVYRLISVVREAERLDVKPEEIQDIDKDKLALVLPVATKENVAERLADARELSRSDVQQLYAGHPEYAHGSEREYVCRFCGRTNRVNS